MAEARPGWRKLENNVAGAIAPKPLGVELLPSDGGRLRMSCRNGTFPEGELLLVLSTWAETEHWYVPAWLEEGVLTADVSGVNEVWDPEDGKPFIVTLAKREGESMTQYPLRARRYLNRLRPKGRCDYFFNDRDLWSDPVDRFCREGEDYEAIPRYLLKEQTAVVVALTVTHRELRYWEQFSYGLELFLIRDGRLLLGARAPENAPALTGFSLHRADGDPRGQRFFPAGKSPSDEGLILGAVELSALPMDGAEYALSGVLTGEDGAQFCVPLSVTGRKAFQAAELLANGAPVAQSEGLGCYFQIDELCRPFFRAAERPLTCQDGPEGMSLREAVEEKRLPVQGHWAIRDLGGQDWQWRFEVPGVPLEEGAELLLTAENKGERLYCQVQISSSGSQGCLLTADLTSVPEQLQNSRVVRWDLSLAVRQGTSWQNVLLRCPERTARRKLKTDAPYRNVRCTYGKPLGVIELGEQQVEGVICCPTAGYCKLQTADRIRRYERQVTCRAEQVSLRFGKLRISVHCPEDIPGEWSAIALVHRYRLEVDRKIYLIPAKKVVKRDGEVWMTGEIRLSDFQLEPIWWDVRAAFRGEDGQTYLAFIQAPKQKKEAAKSTWAGRWEKLERTLFPGSCRQGEDLTVSLYETKAERIALACQEYSPYSGLAFRLKERLALILFRLFRKQLKQKNIFLCFEKFCCMAQDNGFYFFRHCMESGMEEKMHRSIYYVIDKKQPDYQERLLPYQDHVIQFMSLKHMVYILAARLLISTDSRAHAYAWRNKESIILPRVQNTKKIVFLQHGVIAMKRVEIYNKKTNPMNLFVTSNQREHDIVVEHMGYAPEDVIITGLARWDVLKDKGLEERRILVMPTWRNWLEEAPDLVFRASDYYRNYMSLLNDPRLADLLERRDLYLDFYVHPKFREYLHSFTIQEGGRVRLIPFGEEPLNELMMGCKMLVTDYSSVCWDVYYQGKPVLFYQFDVDKYNETTGAYIDLETELFGDRVMTTEALLDKLEEYAENDFRLPEVYAEMRPRMYAYIDEHNSQRICEEIMKRNW
ncbi:MAG: CDP-glycerol glycerophosphotransferase family protein [Clostridiales bacterium]|nr:CDP-glycerol glycerophosphotransferase family protein [Clostridiales bacterium]